MWLFLFQAQKEYFTVIKNVKKAHQIQDSGEFQVRLNEMCQVFLRDCFFKKLYNFKPNFPILKIQNFDINQLKNFYNISSSGPQQPKIKLFF